MKSMLTAAILLLSTVLVAQDKKIEKLEIHTTSVCDMCKKTIETEMIYEKGVKSVALDLASNTIFIDYDPRKTNPDAIRKGVTKLGYYADDLPGDPEAFKKLPECCQKEGCGVKKDE
ncbi:MAG TPA: heavy-metal-associated domain-containing protein [Flavobacteriales bacterium]|nr:heavy-metal-associated domain-containing protein [Flavobacteriales bacterium]HQV76685.1 heavy-metal-associated domain-containing protein [Flavobacteriales bacterium]